MQQQTSAIRAQCPDKVLLTVCTMDWCDLGVAFAKTVFSDLEVLCWNPGDPYPYHIDDWEGDWIISYRGDFIIPKNIFKRAKKGAINFHPAPPKYRGLGSQHYAIYDGDLEYGSTCHHLAASVDTGNIVDVARFKIAPAETASSLRLHVGAYCLQQFIWLVTDFISQGKPLPISEERWGDRLYKQAEINSWLRKIKETEPDHPCLK
jgi:methionyl-tRNA formyltransferase